MHERHPFLEFLVFALAIGLAGVVAFFGYGRWRASQASRPAVVQPSDDARSGQEPVNTLRGSGTERAVPSLPPLKGSAPTKKKR